jgi:DNA helicase-2/ATP-dependent DNA helicase PcrA
VRERLDSELSRLNPEQLKAVTHGPGPVLVAAGAGSGKTRVLTLRVGYLIGEFGASPLGVLAITFTNKAADEMKRRIASLLGRPHPGMWVSTFHSMCARILRREAPLIGYREGFSIVDDDDAKDIVRQVVRDLSLDPKREKPGRLAALISSAKCRRLGPDAAVDEGLLTKTAGRVYAEYERLLKASNSMDFDDLINKTVELFEEVPAARERYQSMFDWVLVDEYQDTNAGQDRLVWLLGQAHRNVFVVGDEDQAIYSFRGADPSNMAAFVRRFPEATVIRLEENYRSHQGILDAANRLIANNSRVVDKRLFSSREGGAPPVLFQAEDERDEAYFVARQIEELASTGLSYSDVAVFYRTNAQSRVLEEALSTFGIPYKVVGARAFYERREVKDVAAYLKVLVNPTDELSFFRIVNVPRRGIGPAIQQRMRSLAAERSSTYLEVLEHPELLRVGSSALAGLEGLRETFRELERMRKSGAACHELLEALLELSGYLQMWEEDGSPEAVARIESLKELVVFSREFDRVEDLLERIALASTQDDADAGEQVMLMTVHVAKGLEFPVVFVTGLEEGVFPHQLALEEGDEGLEEERRLCYVAVTRAKERLYLSWARARSSYWDWVEEREPSRFVEEMFAEAQEGTDYVVMSPGVFLRRKASFSVGDRVRHAHFGEGVVVKVTSSGADQIIEVHFMRGGRKKLLASIAPLLPA